MVEDADYERVKELLDKQDEILRRLSTTLDVVTKLTTRRMEELTVSMDLLSKVEKEFSQVENLSNSQADLLVDIHQLVQDIKS